MKMMMIIVDDDDVFWRYNDVIITSCVRWDTKVAVMQLLQVEVLNMATTKDDDDHVVIWL